MHVGWGGLHDTECEGVDASRWRVYGVREGGGTGVSWEKGFIEAGRWSISGSKPTPHRDALTGLPLAVSTGLESIVTEVKTRIEGDAVGVK